MLQRVINSLGLPSRVRWRYDNLCKSIRLLQTSTRPPTSSRRYHAYLRQQGLHCFGGLVISRKCHGGGPSFIQCRPRFRICVRTLIWWLHGGSAWHCIFRHFPHRIWCLCRRPFRLCSKSAGQWLYVAHRPAHSLSQMPQYSMCMNNGNPNIQTPTQNMKTWSGSQIDDVANLKQRKILMEVGTSDFTVGPNPMNALKQQLSGFSTAANTAFVSRSGQAHTFPTDFDSSGNNACGSSSSPYISNCGYDGAGAVLKWMYGTLQARSSAAQGTFVNFAQSGKYGSSGMGQTGYLYVPKSCQDGSKVCKLHVSLHGCLQTIADIQNKYTVSTGYNLWAGETWRYWRAITSINRVMCG